MAADGKNRWIVLLNKSPKGPFVADEIRALLEQKIIRRNDIAYQLPSDTDSKSPTEWKLLWQFPEFDRRRDQAEAPAPKPSIVVEIPAERRQSQPPTLAAEVPAELLNIAPEDLIPKSTTISTLSAPLERGDLSESAHSVERPDLETMRSAFSAKWIFGSFGTVLVAVVGWMLYSTGAGRPTPVAAPRAIAAPTHSENRPAERRAVMTRPSMPPTSTPAPAAPPLRRSPAEAPRRYAEPEVSEPDSGEIEEGDEESEAEERPMDPRRMADPRFRTPGMPGMDPADPRMMDPRMMDPRMMDPRMMDPRFRGGRRGRMPADTTPPEDGPTGEDAAVPADGGPDGDDPPSDD